jgi:hypothetical protein
VELRTLVVGHRGHPPVVAPRAAGAPVDCRPPCAALLPRRSRRGVTPCGGSGCSRSR